MSNHLARSALERMNLREVAIAPHYNGLATDLQQMAHTDPDEGQKAFLARRAELCSAYGLDEVEQRKPFAFSQGVAIIPVTGTLINRFGRSYGFVTGYNFVRSQLALALNDEDVKAIVFDLNSYGGEAAGCFELADEIFAARGKKPMLGVIDSNCYSACYAIGSALERLVITPTGGAGSIGVVAMHVDMSKMLEDWGIKVTFIHSGEHKVDGNPFEPLPEDVRADIQKGCDQSWEKFYSMVARNRGLDAEAVRATQARCYRADDALRLGLLDAIATPNEAVRAFFSELSGSSTHQLQQQEDGMSTEDPTKPDQAATEKAAAEARTAERARVSGILNCEEAKGRDALAKHLAMNTDLSVEDASAILAAAPKESEAAAPTQRNSFEAAMNADEHPEVGADSGAGAELTAAQAILKAQAAATGKTVN